ncbi:MAG: hypothetical protein ACRC5C_14045 [Bacilli bacterium]
MQNITITGAPIRMSVEGVSLIANTTHQPVGIESVGIDPKDGSLVVTRIEDDQVVTTSVTPDETLARLGVTVGLSGGGKTSKVYFYQNGVKLNLNNATDYAKIATSATNLWFMTVNVPRA